RHGSLDSHYLNTKITNVERPVVRSRDASTRGPGRGRPDRRSMGGGPPRRGRVTHAGDRAGISVVAADRPSAGGELRPARAGELDVRRPGDPAPGGRAVRADRR